MQDIDNIISNCINQISDKIIGVNFLEKFKYLLIEKIKSHNFTKLDNNEIEFLKEYQDNKFSVKITKITNNVSEMNKMIDRDTLCIIIDGFKTTNVKHNLNHKLDNNIYLSKFMGIVLPKNTKIDELINKDTILMYVYVNQDEKIFETENTLDLKNDYL